MTSLPEKSYSTEELMRLAGVSDFVIGKLEKLGLVTPVEKKMGPGGKVFSRRDVLNCLRVVALSRIDYRPVDAAHYADMVRRFRRLTLPYLKHARVEPMDAAVYLFHPDDLFPGGDPANIDWKAMPVELAEKVFDELEAIMLQVAIFAGRYERIQKTLETARGIVADMTELLLPAVEQAYDERGGTTAALRKFQFIEMKNTLMNKVEAKKEK